METTPQGIPSVSQAFFDMGNAILQWVMQQRPNWQPTPDPSIQTLVNQCQAWDWLFPIHETLICFGLMLTFFTAVTVWKWIIKVADYIADVIP